MKLSVILTLLAISIVAHEASAHGENKPGPNGGFIRMPGAFHTEVVSAGPNRLKIFLLDIAWKNPSVKQSAVKATHVSQTKTTSIARCEPLENHYVCEFPKNVDLAKSGEIKLESHREGKNGVTVSYSLPLKLQAIDDGHGSHK